jgi:hypothetical protein
MIPAAVLIVIGLVCWASVFWLVYDAMKRSRK